MLIVISIILTFISTIFILPNLIKLFIKYQVGDPMDNRRMHQKFTPTSGGIAVFIPTLISISVIALFLQIPDLWIIVFSILMVSLIGVYDDFSNLRALFKLVATCIPTVILISMTDIRIQGLYGLFGINELSLSSSNFLTFLVVLFLTNAFNLIDGVDGLLSSISSFVLFIFGTWFLLIGEYHYCLVSCTLLGGILGFLVFNWHPAKLFMGDSGSLGIGFTISILAIAFLQANETIQADSIYKIKSPVSLVIALLILPIFDTLRVFTIRIFNKQSPFSPDKRHIHHYLNNLNFGHKKITLSLLYFSISAFVVILLFNDLSDSILIPVIAISLFFCSIGMFLYNKVDLKSEKENIVLNTRYKVNS